jgi:hypothetical protein
MRSFTPSTGGCPPLTPHLGERTHLVDVYTQLSADLYTHCVRRMRPLTQMGGEGVYPLLINKYLPIVVLVSKACLAERRANH